MNPGPPREKHQPITEGMSETPRADAFLNWEMMRPGVHSDNERFLIEFARTLERELAEAKREAEEQARLNGMGAQREAALMGKVERMEREREGLRAALIEVDRWSYPMAAILDTTDGWDMQKQGILNSLGGVRDALAACPE